MGKSLRMRLASSPGWPTTLETAMRLCRAIMLPAAAPMVCRPRIAKSESEVVVAAWAWTAANSKLETVALPVTKAPKAPINGAVMSQGIGMRLMEAPMYCGRLGSPLALVSA